MAVVMIDVLGEDDFELTPGEGQHSVEALPADRADEALGEGVDPWGSDRRADDPDPLGAKDLVEAGRELGVPVPHQEPDGSSPLVSTMVRFRACWTTHALAGLAVTPVR